MVEALKSPAKLITRYHQLWKLKRSSCIAENFLWNLNLNIDVSKSHSCPLGRLGPFNTLSFIPVANQEII